MTIAVDWDVKQQNKPQSLRRMILSWQTVQNLMKCPMSSQFAKVPILGILVFKGLFTLKMPRKNASEKLGLLKSSAANYCLTLLTNLSKEANRVDPDKTAPIGAV